jgi:hypothetical protein
VGVWPTGERPRYFDFDEKRPRISLQPFVLVVHATLLAARRRASVGPTVRDSLAKRSSSGTRGRRRDTSAIEGFDPRNSFFFSLFHILLPVSICALRSTGLFQQDEVLDMKLSAPVNELILLPLLPGWTSLFR